MNILRIVSTFILILFSNLTLVTAQHISVSITDIIANQKIYGSVSGLSSQDCSKYKIIVYVHTDKWYIHPYAGQDESKSWASILPDGRWQIQTVQREFKADKIAAILVKRNYPEPSKTENLERIQQTAIIIRKLRGTLDYGKL